MRGNERWAAHLKRTGLASALLMLAMPAMAVEVPLPKIDLGAGIRSSFTSTNIDGTSDGDSNDFHLGSARLYLSGTVTDTIKFTLNTEYKGDNDNSMQICDAIGRFEFSPSFNIWAGRFLPPSDRANLYGPYYANNFGVFQDGVQDGYPGIAVGRDNGVAYWGDFGRLKVSLGVFDVPSTLADPGSKSGKDVLAAGRLQVDFWDLEPGYYLNGTYYGEKDILAIGVAAQTAGGDDAYSVDFLLEKKMGGGAFTIESEYAKYDDLGGYQPGESDGYYALAAYLFPTQVGIGKFQLLGKYGEAKYDDIDAKQKTTEVDLNYVIKAFNARVSLFYIGTDYKGGPADVTQIGVGLQLQI